MQAGMSANVCRFTILGSPLLARYVTDQITKEGGDPFLIGIVEEEAAGMVSWRRTGNTLFLNHLYVLPEFRGRGLARALLVDGLERFATPEVETVGVDVFSESPVARAWYGTLGFQTEYRRVWLETALPAPRSMSDGQCNVDGLEFADQQHARQGFSQFKLITFDAEYSIGRLADGVFRSMSFNILRDRPALAGLAALDASRTLICVGAPEDLSPEAARTGRVIEESERLIVSTEHLRTALSTGPSKAE